MEDKITFTGKMHPAMDKAIKASKEERKAKIPDKIDTPRHFTEMKESQMEELPKHFTEKREEKMPAHFTEAREESIPKQLMGNPGVIVDTKLQDLIDRATKKISGTYKKIDLPSKGKFYNGKDG